MTKIYWTRLENLADTYWLQRSCCTAFYNDLLTAHNLEVFDLRCRAAVATQVAKCRHKKWFGIKTISWEVIMRNTPLPLVFHKKERKKKEGIMAKIRGEVYLTKRWRRTTIGLAKETRDGLQTVPQYLDRSCFQTWRQTQMEELMQFVDKTITTSMFMKLEQIMVMSCGMPNE